MEILHINYNEILKNVRISRAFSNLKLDELLNIQKDITKKMDVVQLIDPNAIISQDHIRAAYLNAYMNFIENKNVSNNMSMELLLYLSFTKQINMAIKLSGIKKSNDFVIVASSEPILRQFCSMANASANPYEHYNNENKNAMLLFGIETEHAQIEDILLKMSEIKLGE